MCIKINKKKHEKKTMHTKLQLGEKHASDSRGDVRIANGGLGLRVHRPERAARGVGAHETFKQTLSVPRLAVLVLELRELPYHVDVCSKQCRRHMSQTYTYSVHIALFH